MSAHWMLRVVTALAMTAAGMAQAQTTGFYVRASANYQQNRDVPLSDNLPPGPGSWFGYGVPGNPFGFVIPGNPNEGDKHSHSNRWGGGMAFGYRASALWRYEVSVDRSSGSTVRFAYPSLAAPSPDESGWFSVTSTQFMGNVALDIAPLLPADTLGPFSPYVTAGAGVSRNANGDYLCNSLNSCTAYSFANAATHYDFAWQAGLGFVWKMTPAMAMDFSYRYVDMGTTRGANVQTPFPAWGLNGRLTANRFSVGLVYSFGGK